MLICIALIECEILFAYIDEVEKSDFLFKGI